MTCDKCKGLLVPDDYGNSGDQRCFNCGKQFPVDWTPAAPITIEEPVKQKQLEVTMALGQTCTHCDQPAAEDSVKCPRHRDIQKRANQNYAKKVAEAAGKIPKKVGRPKQEKAEPPTGLIEYKPAVPQVSSPTLTLIDQTIAMLQADMDALTRAREVMRRVTTPEAL